MAKLCLFFILILLFFFPFSLTAREPSDITGDKFEETAGKGLSIRTSPVGAKVFINNVERGFTPVIFSDLQPGEYSIRLTRDGYKDRLFNVVLFSYSRMEVTIKMEEERGLVRVSVHKTPGSPDTLPLAPQIISSQQGDISQDEAAQEAYQSAGFTALLNLPIGQRTIRARAFGWEDATATVLINEHIIATVEIYMRPTAFKLDNLSQSRKRFNPKDSNNLGATEYRFEVSAPGTGYITITDKNGEVFFKKQMEQFNSRNQSFVWNGKNSSGETASEGIYTATIEAFPLPVSPDEGEETFETKGEVLKLETEINYSISIFPLSLSGGLPGLVYAPLPQTLSARSFQIEAGILLGNFREMATVTESLGERPFSALPFEIGLRVSPYKKLEASLAFNANPRFSKSNDSKNGWGITSTVKYNFLDSSGGVPLFMAVGVSYAYASEKGEAPLSPGRGVGIYAPLALEIWQKNYPGAFTIVFSPAAFWRGPEKPAPSLLLGAGLQYRGSWFNAGLSARPEIDFNAPKGEKFRLQAGVEARFYPPPSFLVISFQTGIRTHRGRTDGYGGIGIGVIF